MNQTPKSRSRIARLAAVLDGAALLLPPAARAEEPKFRIGVVTFLSGAAAGPFGVPARNGAEVLEIGRAHV
jgi:branched-chain amino acid transport system substrate-binding protein